MEKQNNVGWLIARITPVNGAAPEWILLFASGKGQLHGEGSFLIDEVAFDIIDEAFIKYGNDLVIDYEHQTLSGDKAPAAGWISSLEWDPDRGIMARVEWTDQAKEMIMAGEYRYHSPVFMVRESDERVVELHSVALTNTPKTLNLAPLVAKLSLEAAPDNTNTQKEEKPMLKRLIAKFGLDPDATEDQVIEHITGLMAAPRQVIAKDIITTLDLPDDADVSVCVASINALKQVPKGMVTREEHNLLVAKLTARDADDAVAKAAAAGKITPDQTAWAKKYATDDLDGFSAFVAKAPVVVPLDKLAPRKEVPDPSGAIDDVTLSIAKQMGNSEADLKQYGGLGAGA
jgi:phage I-like protein